MAAIPDVELLRAAQTGDEAALDELLARHEKQVFRFGLRMCGSEEDARDVLQETLVAAFQGLPNFRGDADISTWLYQIARSFCSKARRRRAGEPLHTQSLDLPQVRALASDEPGPDARTHARDIGNVLQAAIRSLPENYREVILLKDVEGLSAEDAALVLGEQLTAVKSRLHRARMALRSAVTTLLGTTSLEGEAPPCPALKQLFAGDASGEINQATCVRLEEHLAHCPQCEGACDALQRTVSLCRSIPGDAVPEAVRRAVKQALVLHSGMRR